MNRPQSVLDALADAQTLAGSGVVNVAGDSFYVVAAALLGNIAARKMRGDGRIISNTDAGSTARDAATAAFRAVPALRDPQ